MTAPPTLPSREKAAKRRLRQAQTDAMQYFHNAYRVADMERTVGMGALALIRSGGLLFVRAANEGRTVIEMYPRERITEDFDALADRLVRTHVPEASPADTPQRSGFRLFGRSKEPARA